MHIRLAFFIFLIAILTSCQSGYKKNNGKWVWISYDEGVGKRVTEISSADHGTFQVLNNKSYAVDKNNVYFMTEPIKNANPKTFTVLTDNGYSMDDKKVYLDWDEVIFADPKSFEILSFPYAKDKSNVFCGTLPLNLPKEELIDFKVTNVDISMSDIRTSILKSRFIEENAEFKWLDTLDIEGVIIGEFGTAETKNRRFKGFKEIKD